MQILEELFKNWVSGTDMPTRKNHEADTKYVGFKLPYDFPDADLLVDFKRAPRRPRKPGPGGRGGRPGDSRGRSSGGNRRPTRTSNSRTNDTKQTSGGPPAEGAKKKRRRRKRRSSGSSEASPKPESGE